MSDAIPRLNAALAGRYTIERQLGEGGMATVYLADDLRHDRKVALKVLKPELAAVVGAERFLAEIKTTANLQHPHILPLHDSGDADGLLFYVMPHVEGESLRDRLDREHQLPVDEAVQIAKNVAEALDYAHSRGVIHRDIKPANILLQTGKPVISDFGIALAVTQGGAGRLTETGLSLGTPHYMSPEQATGDTGVGAGTDIYALGCVLYEMLVGEPPYTGSTPQAILGKIIMAQPVSATEVRRTVPANVDGAIRKALEKVPADRFGTASDFAKALGDPGFRHGEVVGGGGFAAPSVGPWKWVAVVTTSLAVVMTLAFAWALLDPAPPPVTTRFAVQLPDDQRFAPDGGDLDLSSDGSLLVYRGVGAEGGTQLWMRRWDALDATPIPGTEGAFYPAISPDGQEVAFTSGVTFGGGLRVVSLSRGVARTLVERTPDRRMCCPRWSPDGAWIYFGSYSEGIARVPSQGGAVEIVGASGASESTAPNGRFFMDVLPDGNGLVYSQPGGDGLEIIRAMDVETGVATDVAPGRYPRYTATGHLVFQGAEGVLLAAPFDVRTSALTGPAVPVMGQMMAPSRGSLPSFFALSRSGTLVYIPGGDVSEERLVRVDRAGREEPLDFAAPRFGRPRFSPDGRRLAVAQGSLDDQDVWVFDLERGSRTRLTFGGINPDARVLAWSPRGDRLTFSGGQGSAFFLGRTATDGGGGTDTLLVREETVIPSSWSPDGRVLAFYDINLDTQRDLWVLPLGGEAEPILRTPFNERGAMFSPDGRWLAYVSNQSGQDEIYVRPYPGPGPVATVSTTGGTEPVWSPDGTELFYRTPEELMVVAVDGTDGFRAERPRVLFSDSYRRNANTGDYDIAPDGEHFVMVSSGGLWAQGTLVLVQNFFEELKRLVPN